ncbi:hypothetical protein H8356DRAFT_1652483 [Neocallimastix lanati (nom. inval.)]|uniref:Ribonuclease P/MRP protein subunit POP5 n=1 Tax=Neocallimastix californiae TaxID=1754190 RepID=A0A1Y2B9F2_9FUNG|nr:hypothetical protein H8356DRAFT_1652483 [Neocallimastix sp. JGI-2020a]ORY31472.1 hypothetical protein LY90DRAFT_673671 [Neocallimastix californiae]|eukprot:ORY31472.1 hypothetical protein LY90DRAFT_673671 [Neocallimastix californiae]
MVRFKNRYILFEIVYDEDEEKKINVNYSIISKAIKTSIEQNFGAYGIGIIQSSFTIKYFSPVTKIGILRSSRKQFNMIWASLTFINNIQNNGCLIRVLHVGGTIKSTQKAAIKYDQEQLLSIYSKIAKSKNTKNDNFDIEEHIQKSYNDIMSIEV